MLSTCTDRINKSSVLVSNTGSIHPEPGELVTVASSFTKSLWFSARKIKHTCLNNYLFKYELIIYYKINNNIIKHTFVVYVF